MKLISILVTLMNLISLTFERRVKQPSCISKESVCQSWYQGKLKTKDVGAKICYLNTYKDTSNECWIPKMEYHYVTKN